MAVFPADRRPRRAHFHRPAPSCRGRRQPRSSSRRTARCCARGCGAQQTDQRRVHGGGGQPGRDGITRGGDTDHPSRPSGRAPRNAAGRDHRTCVRSGKSSSFSAIAADDKLWQISTEKPTNSGRPSVSARGLRVRHRCGQPLQLRVIIFVRGKFNATRRCSTTSAPPGPPRAGPNSQQQSLPRPSIAVHRIAGRARGDPGGNAGRTGGRGTHRAPMPRPSTSRIQRRPASDALNGCSGASTPCGRFSLSQASAGQRRPCGTRPGREPALGRGFGRPIRGSTAGLTWCIRTPGWSPP